MAARDGRRNVCYTGSFHANGYCTEAEPDLSQNQLVDHLKFRIDLFEGFLVKYSVLHGGSGHHDGDNIVKRPMECHFPEEYLP